MKRRFIIVLSIFAILIVVGGFVRVLAQSTNGAVTVSTTQSNNQAAAYAGFVSANAAASAVQTTPLSDEGITPTPTFSQTSAPKPVSQDAISAIRAIPQASTFVSLLKETGVVNELSTAGTYTFFVPTNDAIAHTKVGTITYLSLADKKRLAEYHIVAGQMKTIETMKYGFMTMLSRDKLNSAVFAVSQMGGNTHIVATYPAPNGIIYLIDEVLLPPTLLPFPFR